MLVEPRDVKRKVSLHTVRKTQRCGCPIRSVRKEEVLIIKDKTREWKGKFKKRTGKQVTYLNSI